MKELKVDKTKCFGCGACASMAPDHFTMGDDGLSEAISQENLDDPNVQNAVDSCPVGAITIEEKKN